MQCPACKADNAQGPLCRRCKADLSLLFELDAHREYTLLEARQSVREGRWDDAARLARRADGLRSDAGSRRLVAVTAVLSRAYYEAIRYYRSVDGVSTLQEGKNE